MKYVLMKICAATSMVLIMGCESIITDIIIFTTSRVLEVHDIKPFRVIFNPSLVPEIELKGALIHSATIIHKVETIVDGKIMKIIFHGALVSKWDTKKHTGYVDHKFTIPDSVVVVTFGSKETILWERSPRRVE